MRPLFDDSPTLLHSPQSHSKALCQWPPPTPRRRDPSSLPPCLRGAPSVLAPLFLPFACAPVAPRGCARRGAAAAAAAESGQQRGCSHTMLLTSYAVFARAHTQCARTRSHITPHTHNVCRRQTAGPTDAPFSTAPAGRLPARQHRRRAANPNDTPPFSSPLRLVTTKGRARCCNCPPNPSNPPPQTPVGVPPLPPPPPPPPLLLPTCGTDAMPNPKTPWESTSRRVFVTFKHCCVCNCPTLEEGI